MFGRRKRTSTYRAGNLSAGETRGRAVSGNARTRNYNRDYRGRTRSETRGRTDNPTARQQPSYTNRYAGRTGTGRRSRRRLPILKILLTMAVVCGIIAGAKVVIDKTRRIMVPPTVTAVPGYTTAPTAVPGYTAAPAAAPTSEPEPATEPERVYEQDVVYRFYRSCLTGEMLSAYDQIVAEVSQEKTTAHISMNGNGWSDKLGDVVDAVRYDHPEFFWLEGGMSYSYYEENGREVYDVDLYSAYSEAEIPGVNKKIENICRPVIASLENASQYEKVLGVYEYLIDHTIYDLNYGAQNMSSVLVDGRGVCVGYSTALDYLLKELGIRCIAIGGEAGGGGHAWNLVEINGEWYEIDPTWGDPVTGDGTQTKTFHYFCITDEEMGRDHSLGDWYRSYPLPKCSATSCNYYRMNGRYLESFDRDTIIKWVQEDSPQGKATVFKCANASVHSQVVRLFDSDGIWKLRGTLPESYKCVSWDGEDSVQLICSIQFSKK